MGVATDLIMKLVRHVAPPVQTDGVDTISVAGGAVLSYNQLAGALIALLSPVPAAQVQAGCTDAASAQE